MLPCVPYVLEVKTTSYGKHCVFPLFVPFEVLSNDKSDSEKKAPPVIHPGTRNMPPNGFLRLREITSGICED